MVSCCRDFIKERQRPVGKSDAILCVPLVSHCVCSLSHTFCHLLNLLHGTVKAHQIKCRWFVGSFFLFSIFLVLDIRSHIGPVGPTGLLRTALNFDPSLLSAECLDYRHVPTMPGSCRARDQTQGFSHARKVPYPLIWIASLVTWFFNFDE